MRASMARFSTAAAGVPTKASDGAFARSPTMTPMPVKSVRTRAALQNSHGPSFASSSMGRSLLSTSASANAKKPSARGSVATASAPGDAAAFLKSEGISEADVAAIAAKYPQVATAGVDTVLRPKIDLLKKEAGLSDPAKLGAVLAAQPRALLAASLERHLAPTVAFFTAAEAAGGLGMRRTTLARIASKRPILLTYDREEQIGPKVKFFEELGLSTAQIRGMVAASPDVLSIGIGNDLQPTVAWIRSIGIDGKDLAQLLAHHPTIFHNPLHVARENVKLLKGSSTAGGGEVAKGVKDPFPALELSEAQAAKVMLGAPVLFRRPLTGKSMRAKLRYWSSGENEGGLGRSFAELADAPRFLERSLRSSAPRIEFAQKISSGALPRSLAPLLEGPEGAFATEKLGAPGEQAAFEAFRLEWSKKSAGKWGLN